MAQGDALGGIFVLQRAGDARAAGRCHRQAAEVRVGEIGVIGDPFEECPLRVQAFSSRASSRP
jgi:hypothetical protein